MVTLSPSVTTVAVCDATSLEHSLGLVLQISEVCENLIVCLNLSDEAERLGIKIDEKKLSEIHLSYVLPLQD